MNNIKFWGALFVIFGLPLGYWSLVPPPKLPSKLTAPPDFAETKRLMIQDAVSRAAATGQALSIQDFAAGEPIPTKFYSTKLREDMKLSTEAHCPPPSDVTFGAETLVTEVGDDVRLYGKDSSQSIVIGSTAIQCSLDFGNLQFYDGFGIKMPMMVNHE